MIAVSQPSTPRPTSATDPSSTTRNSYTTPAFHSSPYPGAMTSPATPRKRARSDSLFPAETGPFFSSTKPFDNLFAMDRTTLLSVRIQSKMDRGFFLADNDWTCYRRNYFQISSAFTVHGLNHYYADYEPQCLVRKDDGTFMPVRRFLLGISARVSNSDKRIELVQHTPKRDKGPQITPQPKPITAGGNLSMSSVGTNQSIATFERIQFKTATANNGKRRAAQQYYVCVTDLYAETDHGDQVKIASCQSAPLVVRGRSPGHYTDGQQERHQQHPQHQALPPPPPAPQTAAVPPPSGEHHHPHSAMTAPRPPYTPPPMMANGGPTQAPNGSEYSSYPYYSSYPMSMQAPLAPSMVMTPPTPSSGPPPSPHPYAAPPQPTPPQHAPSHHPYMLSSMARSHSQSAYY
ncbi:p53-like transcription factor [Lichtheimia hyalospora FSU 10163]|nr:p53-like transcription factor [Lichtheimia hyalospora FSU 10163]